MSEHIIYINQPLTSHKIMALLDKHPDLKKITCPPSLYRRIAPRYLDVLSKLGVEVEPIEKLGRPKKYGKEDKESVEKLFQEGRTPKEISDILGIPVKTVYYLNQNQLQRGRKFKYPPETVRKVKISHDKGLTAREISESLNIPLRTVYDLLKKR